MTKIGNINSLTLQSIFQIKNYLAFCLLELAYKIIKKDDGMIINKTVANKPKILISMKFSFIFIILI